jgi:hypothetical protein
MRIPCISTVVYLLSLFHFGKAVAAIDRSVALGLKGNFGLTTASRAGSGEVLPGTAGRILAGVAAGLAALGLILEAALCIELLLSGSKHELCSTFLTHQGLVFVHFESSLLKNTYP